jgi:hypothetical protein
MVLFYMNILYLQNLTVSDNENNMGFKKPTRSLDLADLADLALAYCLEQNRNIKFAPVNAF